MKRIYDASLFNASLSASAGSSALSEAEKTALAEEIANDPKGRGYAGKSAIEILWLLGNEYQEPNPEPQGSVPIKEWNRDELYNILLQAATADGLPVLIAIEALQSSDNPQIAVLAKQALLTVNAPLKAINLENEKVFQGFAALAQIGVLTPETYAFITSKPDPEWPKFLQPKRRLWEMFGEGVCIDLADIEEAVA